MNDKKQAMKSSENYTKGLTKPVVAPALYARASSHDQDCALQLDALRDWFAYMKYPTPVEYVDHAISGAKKSRPKLDAFMKAASAGEHDFVAVWKLDRFGRSVRHLKNALAQLEDAHVRFVSITQGIDTDPSVHNSTGRMMLNILAMVAELERDTLIERVNAGRMVKFNRGEPDAWNLVYGFQSGKPIESKPEADLIRKIFQWRDEEYSSYELEELVTMYANAHVLKPPQGGKWSARTILRWLRSRQYICEYHRGGEVFTLPRIVDQDLWERVNAKMEATRRKNEGNPKLKYTWTGFLYSEHDRPMTGVQLHRGSHEYYRCLDAARRSKIVERERCACPYLRADALEPCWDALWAFINDPVMQRSQALALAKQEDDKKPARGKSAAQKLAAAKAKIERIKRLAIDGVLDEAEAKRETQALREAMQGYEAEVRAMGKVIEIASKSSYEQACEARAKVREPKDADLRRIVLEGIRDLKVRLTLSGEADITGSLPVASEQAGGDSNNRDNRSSEREVCVRFLKIPNDEIAVSVTGRRRPRLNVRDDSKPLRAQPSIQLHQIAHVSIRVPFIEFGFPTRDWIGEDQHDVSMLSSRGFTTPRRPYRPLRLSRRASQHADHGRQKFLEEPGRLWQRAIAVVHLRKSSRAGPSLQAHSVHHPCLPLPV